MNSCEKNKTVENLLQSTNDKQMQRCKQQEPKQRKQNKEWRVELTKTTGKRGQHKGLDVMKGHGGVHTIEIRTHIFYVY